MLYLLPAAAYLLGSIPFGLLAGLLARKDIRNEGSGNIGATNVVRVCGWKWGLPVFALDALKGFAPAAWLAPRLAPGNDSVAIAVALAAILGHNFPVWLKFKGGKGVATSAGALLALLPQEVGIAFAAFLLTLLAFRYVSLGSMAAGAALVAARMLLTENPCGNGNLPRTALAAALCALLFFRHRANIRRLLSGTESKLWGGTTPRSAGAAEDAGKAAG